MMFSKMILKRYSLSLRYSRRMFLTKNSTIECQINKIKSFFANKLKIDYLCQIHDNFNMENVVVLPHLSNNTLWFMEESN